MAIKRMFDKTIIELDSFADLPMTTKAIYFLLGMEADDEGFVSTKRVMKLHGGSDDDIKVLIAKSFLMPFENGVVVITHWHGNNWIDSRRMKPTQYQKERASIKAIKGKYMLLSDCLADAKREEYRVEESSIEESTVVSSEERTKRIRKMKEEFSKKVSV